MCWRGSLFDPTGPDMLESLSTQDVFLSRRDIAQRHGVCIETIKRRERAGLLHPLRFNSRLIRYRLSDVEAYERQAEGRGA